MLRTLADFLHAFMWQADPATLRVTFVSEGVRDLLGHPVSRWLGTPGHWTRIIQAEDREKVVACLRATAADGEDREIDFRVRAADGRALVLRHAVRLVNGELWGLTTDRTADRRAKERYKALSAQAEEFRRRSLEDPLTGLPNRILLDDRLETALREARRSTRPLAVLMLDLDGFKVINDTRGHLAGDEVLRRVALVLRIALRDQDTPARLGGDEFAAVLPDTGAGGAIRSVERIIEALEEIGASIGIAVSPDHGTEAEELLEHADRAMYAAKQRGGGYALFSPDVAPVTRGRPERRGPLGPGRRAALALAAALAILSASMSPTVLQPANTSATSRLAAATVALQVATVDDVRSAVGGAEVAISSISWKDVIGEEVVNALDALEQTLGDLQQNVPKSLTGRVGHLIATVHQAQAVATVAANLPDVNVPEVPKVEAPDTPSEAEPTP